MASCGDIEIASRPPLTSMISAILTMKIFDELEAYYAQHLSGRELGQFRTAGTGRPCRLLTQIIQPNAYREDRGTYMGVEPRMDVAGRSHLTARELVAGRADWELQSLFTNTLRIARPGDLDSSNCSRLQNRLGK